MERARNSDSVTHVKKYNWTSGTDLSKQSLWDIFLGHSVVDWYDFRLLPCLSPLYENHSAVNAVDSALDTLASAIGKHQVVLKYFGGGGCPHGNDSNEK